MRLFASMFAAGAVSALAVAGSLVLSSVAASAGEVATRCSSYGCTRIVCNYTGDRCHRVDNYADRERYWNDGYRSEYRPYRPRSWRDESYSDWHYDCDHDADACYVRRGDD